MKVQTGMMDGEAIGNVHMWQKFLNDAFYHKCMESILLECFIFPEVNDCFQYMSNKCKCCCSSIICKVCSTVLTFYSISLQYRISAVRHSSEQYVNMKRELISLSAFGLKYNGYKTFDWEKPCVALHFLYSSYLMACERKLNDTLSPLICWNETLNFNVM